jgi:N-hydroxyarylamine O-acetyltransferase
MKPDEYNQYLSRIGYSGRITPDADTLKRLQRHHLLHIPFENLDIHHKIPIVLDHERIFDKIIRRKRGGFCYELNGLFYQLLLAFNFNVTMISARVYDNEKGYGMEFDHMAVIASIGQKDYLCDVGFGEFILEPLELKENIVQVDSRGNFMFDRLNEKFYRVNKVVPHGSEPVYIFQKTRRKLADFTVMCEYHQTSPGSHFTRKSIVSIPTPAGRVTLTGNTLRIRESAMEKEIEVKSDSEYREVLKKWFDIDF